MIARRLRKVEFTDGIPSVNVGGKRLSIEWLTATGTDNPKTAKNANDDWLPVALSMSPADLAGVGTVCPFARNCKKICLNETGRGPMDSVQGARIARTVIWKTERQYFLDRLAFELSLWLRRAERQRKKVCARLNMLSDIPYERYSIIDDYKDIQFYDYSKWPSRFGLLRPNYWVTFSRDSVGDDSHCLRVLRSGGNVAIAFDDGVCSLGRANKRRAGSYRFKFPDKYKGFRVVDGDESDARWTDPRGVWVGLRFKALSHRQRAHAIDTTFAV